MSFEYKEQYQYLSSACLNITDACNLACRYCFVEQHPHYMTLDTAKAAVDYLLNNLHIKKEKGFIEKDAKSFINFFGGEPTLLWDEIIIPLTLYMEEKYPDEIELGITTNGTLLNKEKIDFLYNHNIKPLLSIDGAKETQDINRPCQNGDSSFDKIIEIVPYLLEKFPTTTFRSTIDQNTVSHTFENYIFASYMGFQNIFMIPNSREKWSEDNINILKSELEKIYIFIGQCFSQNKLPPIHMSLINESFEQVLKHDINTLKNIDESIRKRSGFRCGFGTSSGSIGYNGYIYGCQEQDSKNEKNIFYIGTIFKGIDIGLQSNLLKKYERKTQLKCENESLCENCSLRNICSISNCPSTSWDLHKSFFYTEEILCKWKQFLFFNAKVLMHYFTEQNNQIFKDFLNQKCNFNKYFSKEVK